jgi:hypothetical protein
VGLNKDQPPLSSISRVTLVASDSCVACFAPLLTTKRRKVHVHQHISILETFVKPASQPAWSTSLGSEKAEMEAVHTTLAFSDAEAEP